MATALVQQGSADALDANPLPTSLPRSATPGNLLVSAYSVDKDAGGRPTASSGWTILASSNSTSVSVAMAWKIADGDASDTCTWEQAVGSARNGIAWIGEYSGLSSRPNTPVVSTSLTDESSVTRVALGPARADGFGIAVAMVGRDTGASFTWGSGFEEQLDAQAEGGGGPGTSNGLGVADLLDIADEDSVSTAVTHASGDQMSGILALFGTPAPEVVTPMQMLRGLGLL